MDGTGPIEIPTPNRKARCLAFEADRYHIVYGDNLGNIYRCKFDTGVAVSSSMMKMQYSVRAVAVSMDGQWIASADSSRVITIWSAATGESSRQTSQYGNYFPQVIDISSDSKRITAVYTSQQKSTVRIIDVTSGREVAPNYLEHNALVVDVKFSPDGSRIATAGTSVRVFDAHSGKQLFDIPVQVECSPTSYPSPLAWSTDNQQLFVGYSKKITCLDTSTSFYSEWPTEYVGSNVSIVVHDRFIAYSAGSSVSFWDYTSHEQIGIIANDNSPINCIAISYGGRYLACGRDRAITIHDLGGVLPRDYLRVPLVSPLSLLQVSNVVLTSWTLGNPVDTERMLSEEVTQRLQPKHHTLAARSLIRARLKEWKSALEDAEMSLQIKQSPIGQIAKSLALVGSGKLEDALYEFDFVFHDRADRSDNLFLLVVKSVLLFLCSKYPQAISRLRALIETADEKTRDHYMQVLAYMYLKSKDYEHAVQTLELAKIPPPCKHANPLMTIALIFNWDFENIKAIAWERLCQSLYATSSIKQVGEKLLTMVSALDEEEKESAHGRILEAIVMRSGQITLLEWTGKPSNCNSCLPSSPAVYTRERLVLPSLDEEELAKRTDELRTVFPITDALVIYGRITRLQPVRFAHFQLLLPCIVFGVQSLTKAQDHYCAQTTLLGDVKFTTADTLPLEEPRRLVFADLRIHSLLEPQGEVSWEYGLEPNVSSYPGMERGIADPVHDPIIEEVPSMPAPVDTYTHALRLIAHLGQSFSPLLFLRQTDGTYRRVSADAEIVVDGTGDNFPKDVRVEMLEVR